MYSFHFVYDGGIGQPSLKKTRTNSLEIKPRHMIWVFGLSDRLPLTGKKVFDILIS